QMAVQPGSNLETTIAAATAAEKLLLDSFPEVNHVVSKIGTAEIPTDPMSIEDADVMILLKPKDEWTSADSREELVAQMQSALEVFPELSFEFTQPIQLRFNELLTGSKADVAVKIFGDDPDELLRLGRRAEQIIAPVPGAADVKLERTAGLQQLVVKYDREKMARYGIHIDELNTVIESAYAGAFAGIIADGERRFDLVVRLQHDERQHPDLSGLYVNTAAGGRVPLSEVATMVSTSGASMISREDTRRRINLGVNVRGRSLTEVVADIRTAMEKDLVLPPGYRVHYGGEFQNFIDARDRLAVAVPIALALILFLLYLVYRKWKYALLVFAAVPLSAIGGIWLLYLRDMPFSISAGIGFIALFGVSVLNGIVLVSHMNHLIKTTDMTLSEVITQGASDRLRPVLLTALTTTFGFIPMALSTSAGAEVQKPLATVVIGGLVTSTLLTLVILPMLYKWVESRKGGSRAVGLSLLVAGIFTLSGNGATAQESITHEAFMERALSGNPLLEMQQIERDIVAARQGSGWQIGATDVAYSYGQINRADIADDYQWNFNQDFGSIPAHINRGKRNEAALQVSDAELAEYAVLFETGLRIDYLRWVYAHARRDHFATLLTRLDSLNAMVGDQAESGAVSDAERYLFESRVLQLRQMYNEAQVAVRGFQESLERRCLFSLDDFVPAETHTFSEAVEQPENVETSLFTAAQMARVSESEFQVKTSRGAFFPALSAGYQMGRLEGVAGADAFTVGMALPIWYGPDRALLRQANLRVLRENAQLETDAFQSEAAMRRAQADLGLRTAAFERNAEVFKDRSTALQDAALAGFRAGESDVYQLVQGLLTASDLYLNYLETAEALGISKYNLSRFQSR
ncbi:MAG: efflux RND transporter permease subunit, partial [Flavobacteriales bacterium]|nr:efflux RND transporter permease subunit [Flavobacteriales bacterium]